MKVLDRFLHSSNVFLQGQFQIFYEFFKQFFQNVTSKLLEQKKIRNLEAISELVSFFEPSHNWGSSFSLKFSVSLEGGSTLVILEGWLHFFLLKMLGLRVNTFSDDNQSNLVTVNFFLIIFVEFREKVFKWKVYR